MFESISTVQDRQFLQISIVWTERFIRTQIDKIIRPSMNVNELEMGEGSLPKVLDSTCGTTAPVCSFPTGISI